MELINTIATWFIRKRVHQIELFMKYPLEVQKETFQKLVRKGRHCLYGSQHRFDTIRTVRDYQERVPLKTYEGFYPYIERLLKGEQGILWPTEIKWFSKSSGTTNSRSKFIPVSPEALEDCHIKGGKDMLALYFNNYPDSKIFTGKGLGIGGSHQNNHFDKSGTSFFGDVSAVIMQNLPFWVHFSRTPSLEVALMDEWEKKLEQMAELTIRENVTNLMGVPTWTMVLLQRVLEKTGKSVIAEVWPNLELFVHGAVAFGPYRSHFKQLIGRPDMRFLETYNASEGFFGIQDQKDSEEMLLMLDYGVFYEFISLEELGSEHPNALTLDEVQLDKNYALAITTNSGLWRYLIGDTIKFTSLHPFRIKITGRTKHFINAFGEEVVVENAEYAIVSACEATQAVINNFTAGPKYLERGKKGAHEWIIEFEVKPNELERFVDVLDECLRRVNADYDAKRYKDIALGKPVVHVAEKGTFYRWMKSRNKLGGQHKVPRLANNREYLDSILEMLESPGKSMMNNA
ncbi:MAG: GH3 auxin-responsive promoter family protein [Cytophagales bacterium]|nr:GH3 auxin-responsive promoter family protein [Cytophagales bacterium]